MRGASIPRWLGWITWRNVITFLVLNEVRGWLMSGPLWYAYVTWVVPVLENMYE